MVAGVSNLLVKGLSARTTGGAPEGLAVEHAKTFDQQLLAAIADSLERIGLDSKQFQISVQGAARQSVAEPPARRQLLVTYSAPAETSQVFDATEKLDFQPTFMEPAAAESAGRVVDPVTSEVNTYNVNPNAFVDRATADGLAELLGGEVETRQVGEAGGPYGGPVQYLIRVGEYVGDAALIARTFQTYPKWVAELRIGSEIARANGEPVPSWEEAVEILNSGGSVFGVKVGYDPRFAYSPSHAETGQGNS